MWRYRSFLSLQFWLRHYLFDKSFWNKTPVIIIELFFLIGHIILTKYTNKWFERFIQNSIFHGYSVFTSSTLIFAINFDLQILMRVWHSRIFQEICVNLFGSHNLKRWKLQTKLQFHAEYKKISLFLTGSGMMSKLSTMKRPISMPAGNTIWRWLYMLFCLSLVSFLSLPSPSSSLSTNSSSSRNVSQ